MQLNHALRNFHGLYQVFLIDELNAVVWIDGIIHKRQNIYLNTGRAMETAVGGLRCTAFVFQKKLARKLSGAIALTGDSAKSFRLRVMIRSSFLRLAQATNKASS